MRITNDFSRVVSPVLLLIVLALACSLPGQGTPTPLSGSPVPVISVSPSPAPTATPLPPLPPALIETNPPVGSDVPLSGPLTFYFNQPMDRLSVEGALTGQPGLAGRFTWQDDATLLFAPDSPFPPDAVLALTLNSTARATNGLALPEPVNVSYQTAGFLQLSEALPRPDSELVDPTAAVVVAFNQPVVSLGAGPVADPPAFTLSPLTPGQGEWLNTSTYIFYPAPALFGGARYTVTLNPDLISTSGGPLAPEADQALPGSWSFTTASPQLLTFEPDPAMGDLGLDAEFHLAFNQPMDPGSVGEHLGLFDPLGAPVNGRLVWEGDNSEVTFIPDRLLARNSEFVLQLGPEAQAAGGTAIGDPLGVVYQTVPGLDILSTDPAEGETRSPQGGVQIRFNGPLDEDLITENLALSPAVSELSTYWDVGTATLYINGFYQPETDYTLTLSSGLADPWGGLLGKPYQLNFRTGSLPPDLTVALGSTALFLTPEDSALTVQATNLPEIQVSIGTVPLDLFIRLLGPGGYQLFEAYRPEDLVGWTQPLDLPPNQNQSFDLALSPDGRQLSPGLYLLRLNAPGLRFPPPPLLLVVSDVHLTFKLSAQEAFLWAVDLKTNKPLVDIPLTLYNEDGSVLQESASGPTGVIQARYPAKENPYEVVYAVTGSPGDPGFSLALSSWQAGVSGWDFGLPVDLTPPGLKAYVYTDRPIYRPGQTVYFRAALRYAENGRYRIPDESELLVSLLDDQGLEIRNRMLGLSAFGTVHGDFTLPETAPPGFYRLETAYGMVSIQVAEYRKPEIDLQVTLAPAAAEAGQTLEGVIEARYFFGAPAADVQVEWSVYSRPVGFDLPGYQVGPLESLWQGPAWAFFDRSFGLFAESGVGITGADGSLTLDFMASRIAETSEYTLEVTARDESGFPVSARTTALVHPALVYIGLRPEAWLGQAGQEIGYGVQMVDWEQSPVAGLELQAEFSKVVWVPDESAGTGPGYLPEYIPEYTLVAETTAAADGDGRARLSFTPPDPGTYQLAVRSGQAETQVLVWIGGAGQAVWPVLPNQQIRLTADKARYQPGDTAQIFIPNPLGDGVLALVTVERGEVMRHRVITLDGSGVNFQLPLELEDAPNVYVSVIILGRDQGRLDFRQGYLNLVVDPVMETLRVDLAADPVKAGPGEDVTLRFRVTDQAGSPVQGEFSLALVDLATLALAEPNSPDIQSWFYGEQPLGVQNSLALAAYARRVVPQPGGIGGGGGGAETPFLRENFEDTAFWQGDLVTDENGEALVSVVLPDNLTTWRADLRGLTTDTRVGQAVLQVVVTKDLLVRPQTPRFLVAGDHVQLSAVVHNNTNETLEAEVSLQTAGILFDDPVTAVQTVVLAAGDRQRVVWWGTVDSVPEVDLVFSAQAPGYEDAARPEGGLIPVLAYTAPRTYATAGTLFEAGERLELVSLPRTFEAEAGELQLELAPSLAAAAVEALASLEAAPYESNERLVSRFLANLELFHTLQEIGLEPPGMGDLLASALSEGFARLGERQNSDGGWSWWPASRDTVSSDPFITAYVLFGLVRAQATGIVGEAASIENGVRYLQATLFSPRQLTDVWELDRLVFQHYVLAEAGEGNLAGLQAIFDDRARLNPWGLALLALAFEKLDPGSEPVRTLVADLQTTAVRIETGAFWPLVEPGWQNMGSTIQDTAVVVYALSRLDPAGTLLPDSVRYLMAARTVSGGWQSSYETAWGVLALSAFIRGTGELGADFAYQAALNDISLADGRTSPPVLTPVRVTVPLSDLHPSAPNALRIQRDAGPGRLYYRAHLEIAQPVETIAPSVSGLQIARTYRLSGTDCRAGGCSFITEAGVGELVTVELMLVLENDAYYLVVDDHLPAGSEIIDINLQTSQLGIPNPPPQAEFFDPSQPFSAGWGWWWFSSPLILSDRIAWSADFLPAGTYKLTYTLTLTQPGTYRVIPARAWQTYFPEVQGGAAGTLFTVLP